MATNRNKLDEYHLKILRELLTQPANKHCFDCNQRGPTYVNVTIGSFVCTTCSGLLRGLTPPHRVKSITMATFTPEEIDVMKSRGNEYCKSVWLGLHEAETRTRDDQQFKDFMISKYEKKRYYVEPSLANVLSTTNGSRTPSSISSASSSSHNSPSSQSLAESFSKFSQGTIRSHSQSRPSSLPSSNMNGMHVFADFSSPSSSSVSSAADPFNSSMDSSTSSDASFANFDNNPAFDGKRLPGTAMDNSGIKNGIISDTNAPVEDKYAALKDLDHQMKTQMFEKQQQEMKQKLNPNLDWGNTNGTANWTTLFASNGHTISSEPTTPFNPFATGDKSWSTSVENGVVNPFSAKKDDWSDNSWQISHGFSKNQIQNPSMLSNGWNKDDNPFKLQTGMWHQSNGQHHSSNPFL